MKKVFGINLEISVKERIDNLAKEERKSSSGLINQILRDYSKVEKPVPPPEPVQTEEERLKDWEFRKRMVAEGKWTNPRLAEEYPPTFLE